MRALRCAATYDFSRMVPPPPLRTVMVSAHERHRNDRHRDALMVLHSHDLVAANTTQLNRNCTRRRRSRKPRPRDYAAAAPPQPTGVRSRSCPPRPWPSPRRQHRVPTRPRRLPQPVARCRAYARQTPASEPGPESPPAPPSLHRPRHLRSPAGQHRAERPRYPAAAAHAACPAEARGAAGTALAARFGISRTQLVSRFVAGVGAVITLVGVAFILVLAAQSGYFGPLAQRCLRHRRGPRRRRVPHPPPRHRERRRPRAAGDRAAAGYLSLYAAGPCTSSYLWVVLTGTAVLGLAVVAIAVRWKSQWLASLGVASASLLGLSTAPRVGVAFAVVLSVVTILAPAHRWPIFPVACTVPPSSYSRRRQRQARTSTDTVLLSVIAGVRDRGPLLRLDRSLGWRQEQTIIAVLVTWLRCRPCTGCGSGRPGAPCPWSCLRSTPSAQRFRCSPVSSAGCHPDGCVPGHHGRPVVCGWRPHQHRPRRGRSLVRLRGPAPRSRLVALASAVLGSIATALDPGALAWSCSPSTRRSAAASSSQPGLPGVPREPCWFRASRVVPQHRDDPRLLGPRRRLDGVLAGGGVHDVRGYVIASATVTVLRALASDRAVDPAASRAAGGDAGPVPGRCRHREVVRHRPGGAHRHRGLAFLGVGLLLLVLGVGYTKAYEKARTARSRQPLHRDGGDVLGPEMKRGPRLIGGRALLGLGSPR